MMNMKVLIVLIHFRLIHINTWKNVLTAVCAMFLHPILPNQILCHTDVTSARKVYCKDKQFYICGDFNGRVGDLEVLFQESKRFQNGPWMLLCWCFTAFRHFLCRFGSGQLTYPHCSWVSWASLIGSFIPVLVTDNCPSWISGRERMTVEIISWSISTKECCRMWRSNPRPSAYQADAHPTELPRPAGTWLTSM